MFIAICIGLTALGLWLVIHGARRFLRDRQLAAAARSWASTTGVIESASLDARETVDSDGDSTTIHKPVIRYRYPEGGREHVGTRVWLSREEFADESAANSWLAAHPAGGSVAVRFDPARPAESTLVVDGPSLVAAIILVLLGTVMAWTGVALLLGD